MTQRSSDARAAQLATPESDANSERNAPAPIEQTIEQTAEDKAAPQPLRAVPAGSGEPSPRVTVDEFEKRLKRVERQNRWLKVGFVLIGLLIGLFLTRDLLPHNAIVRQTLMESRELKLLDQEGNPRMFLRMYSRVPVLQLLDTNGKPRMSLGLRFDDTPFLDLSDKTGRTRATIEMTTEDEPSIELFDENGETRTKIR